MFNPIGKKLGKRYVCNVIDKLCSILRHRNKPKIDKTLKKILILFLFILCLNSIKASPQAPDILIIGKDTVAIFSLPLNELDSTRQKLFFESLNKYKDEPESFSFNLWRGYQGIWRLEDGKFFLVGLKDNPYSSEILSATFKEKYNNGVVFADWFSSSLVIKKGALLRWDGIFGRTYTKEEILKFKKGRLFKRKDIDNYIDIKKGISRIYNENITDTIFSEIQKLNWIELGEIFCDDEYFVFINKNGRIREVKYETNDSRIREIFKHDKDERKCLRNIRRSLRNLRFDIIKWNGHSYAETLRVSLYYDEETKKLENFTN